MGAMKDFDIRIRNGGDDAIAAASELMPRWISVSERLPENGQQLLACVRLPHWTHEMPTLIETMDYDQGRFLDDDVEPRNYVTHWMPLPEPPPAE